jgi:hypothetical protein
MTYLVRALSPNPQHIRTGYLKLLPCSQKVLHHLASASEVCLRWADVLSEGDLTERLFDSISLKLFNAKRGIRIIAHNAVMHTTEAFIDDATFSGFDLPIDVRNEVLNETGLPAGFFPLIKDYDAIPELPDSLPSVTEEVIDYLAARKRITMGPDKLLQTKTRLRDLFTADSGRDFESHDQGSVNHNSGNEEGTQLVRNQATIPSTTFVEELSMKLQMHPVSVYWLLKEGIEKEDWRCLREERRITISRFTVMILRLLGHRWPKQIEAGEIVPNWADADGVIPLTDGTIEQTLVDRVRKRIAAEFDGGDVAAIEREFREIMGKPLDQWLEVEFFKYHVKQFKKRPIAWQIQSGKYTHRSKPAFACLVYYHKLDGDLVPKIRTQYVGPLRQRFETELRGIEAVSVDARSVRQDKRRVDLEGLIEELKEFETALQQVVVKGFSSKKLETLIAKEKPDKWCSVDGIKDPPVDGGAFLRQERSYLPDINDGVRVNIAPLQKAGLLAASVLSDKDLNKAISDRAEWRADERQWCREGKLPQPGWWPIDNNKTKEK